MFIFLTALKCRLTSLFPILNIAVLSWIHMTERESIKSLSKLLHWVDSNVKPSNSDSNIWLKNKKNKNKKGGHQYNADRRGEEAGTWRLMAQHYEAWVNSFLCLATSPCASGPSLFHCAAYRSAAESTNRHPLYRFIHDAIQCFKSIFVANMELFMTRWNGSILCLWTISMTQWNGSIWSLWEIEWFKCSINISTTQLCVCSLSYLFESGHIPIQTHCTCGSGMFLVVVFCTYKTNL